MGTGQARKTTARNVGRGGKKVGRSKKSRPARSLPDSLLWRGRAIPLAGVVINDLTGEITARYHQQIIFSSELNSPDKWDTTPYVGEKEGPWWENPMAAQTGV